MIAAPDVDALMAGSLGQWLGEQAVVREAAKAKSNWRYTWGAAALLPLLALLWFGPDWGGQLKFFISAAAAGGVAFWGYMPRAEAIKATKSGINAALAEALGITYAHDCLPGTGFARAKAHRMLPSADRESHEDLWNGDLAGTPFTLHESHLEERRGSGKNRHWVTVFRGPIITLGFGRRFHGTTLVERSGRHKKFGFFGEKDELKLEDGTVLAKADMVHPDFEDAFTIYTTDQTEARYLVHPVYIEKLVALEASFSGQDIRTLFAGGELTVVLKAENMFESGSLDARRDREMVEMCVAQFMAMAGLAGSLNEAPR
jgi:Protein of unknown function (DUF3137)